MKSVIRSLGGRSWALGRVVLGVAASVVSLEAGVLDVSFARIPRGSIIDLTAEGTFDWVHWGLYTETSLNRKAGVLPRIGNFELVYDRNNSNAWAFVWQFSDHYNGFSWSDGTPVQSVTETTTGVWAYGVPNLGSGFRIAVPADLDARVLKVYVGVYGGSGLFSAQLSDNSAGPYQSGLNSTLQNLSNGEGAVYTVRFAADSPGQTLTLTWTLKSMAGPGAPQANVTLEAASLSAPGINNPPVVLFTAPAQNDQFPAGTAIEMTAQCLDLDGSISRVAFLADSNLIGETASLPYTVTWNGVPAGRHRLVARATDNEGASADSMPVEIFAYGSGGFLGGTLANSPASVDLTAEGTADWVHWGLESSNSVNRKDGVIGQIGDLAPVGSEPVQRYTNSLTAFAWSDGTPELSHQGTTAGLFQTGVDGGFELVVPADTTNRLLRVYAGLYGAGSEFQAYLSDFSAAAFTDSSVSNVYGTSATVYTLDYRAASAGQSLLVRYRPWLLFDLIYGNVTWQAASLAGGGSPPPLPVTLLDPAFNGPNFAFSFDTELNRRYTGQWSDVLGSGSEWQTWTNVIGTGGRMRLDHSGAGVGRRFYRVMTE